VQAALSSGSNCINAVMEQLSVQASALDKDSNQQQQQQGGDADTEAQRARCMVVAVDTLVLHTVVSACD
jgi:hypothetical protein